MSATTAILDFAAAPHRLPAPVRADALRLLADTLAVGAAGSAAPASAQVRQVIGQWGEGDAARLIAGGRAPAASAAFANGFAIHCLEWDAVHEGAVVHALSAVTAALLAVSDRAGGSDPEEFLVALAVGVEIASGLGVAASRPLTFFRPGTAGQIGAALAAARLAGLSRAQLPDVLGLAYSFVAGTMQAHVEASIALPLQIANAARAAVAAIDCVEAGLDGPHDALEGPFGYATLIEPLDLAGAFGQLGTRWRIAEVSVKPFPSGRASHAALGALAALRASHGLDLASVAGIDHYAPPLIARLVGRPWRAGMAPSYARLCLPFLAPMMLRDGVIDPSLFTPQGLADPALAALGAQVAVHDDGNPDGNAMSPQRLVVRLTDGTRVERAIPDTLGSPEAPLGAAQAEAKYALCRRLADPAGDARRFTDPLSYATGPT